MKEMISKIWKKILTNDFYIAIFIFSIATLIFAMAVIVTKTNICSSSFFEGVVVEMVGMIFDILLLFVFVNFIIHRSEKYRKINFLFEQLEDYREWYEKEAMYRVNGIINRLINLGVKHDEIELKGLHLGKCNQAILSIAINDNTFYGSFYYTNFSNMDLSGKDLSGKVFFNSRFENSKLNKTILNDTIFENSYLREIEISGADIKQANFECVNADKSKINNSSIDDTSFKKSHFYKANFKDSYLKNVYFQESYMVDSDFSNCVLWEVHFEHCDLRSCDFQKSNPYGIYLDNAIVDSLDWIETLKANAEDWLGLDDYIVDSPLIRIDDWNVGYRVKRKELLSN